MTRPQRKKGAPIDWQAVHERMARAQAETRSALALPPERAAAVMDERARLLARSPADAKPSGEVLELLTFALGRERYAIETRFVREVTRLLDFTPVPGAPEFVLGITNLRGEVLAIIDLRKFFGATEKGLTDLSRLVVLGTAATEFGVLADAVHAIDRLSAAEVLDAPESIAGIGREYLRGVTRRALIVIEGDVLLDDARFVVTQGEAPEETRRENLP